MDLKNTKNIAYKLNVLIKLYKLLLTSYNLGH